MIRRYIRPFPEEVPDFMLFVMESPLTHLTLEDTAEDHLRSLFQFKTRASMVLPLTNLRLTSSPLSHDLMKSAMEATFERQLWYAPVD